METDLERTARQKYKEAGLQFRVCSYHHWQIRGGTKNNVVNFWPNGKGGQKIAAGTEKGRRGGLREAIKLAGPRDREEEKKIDPPWEEPKDRVGLIRRFWRWIW